MRILFLIFASMVLSIAASESFGAVLSKVAVEGQVSSLTADTVVIYSKGHLIHVPKKMVSRPTSLHVGKEFFLELPYAEARKLRRTEVELRTPASTKSKK